MEMTIIPFGKKGTPETIRQYKMNKYQRHLLAHNKYVLHHKLSDLIEMIDNGIASYVYSKDEIKDIISKQDDQTQKILLAQFGKYLIS